MRSGPKAVSVAAKVVFVACVAVSALVVAGSAPVWSGDYHPEDPYPYECYDEAATRNRDCYDEGCDEEYDDCYDEEYDPPFTGGGPGEDPRTEEEHDAVCQNVPNTPGCAWIWVGGDHGNDAMCQGVQREPESCVWAWNGWPWPEPGDEGYDE